MNQPLLLGVVVTLLCSFVSPLYAQKPSKAVSKYLEQEEENAKKVFPPKLISPYPKNSLGSKLQELYKEQAKSACGIERSDNRQYIPKELINAYSDNKLKNVQIYDLEVSATNLLFLTLTPNDITSIKNHTFEEKKYIKAKRVLGLLDNLVNYGNSTLNPTPGFEILLYQKSCGSYFNSNAALDINAPIAELKTSLKAETEKSSSITTVTGKFVSPLYSIFKEDSKRSVYAHMLLWEIYYEQAQNTPNPKELLINSGSYISEFDATLTYRAQDKKQSMDMGAQLSSSVSFSVINASGQVRANLKNAMSFSLKKFDTFIHKLDNDELSWDPIPLPSKEDIEEKLQNSFISAGWTSSKGYATHLLPLKLSRTMVGIPASLCKIGSWQVAQGGFDTSIWKERPEVVSESHHKEGQIPDCSCTIVGQLKKVAIDKAMVQGGFLNIQLSLVNTAKIGEEQLTIPVIEKNVQVTNNPKIININSEHINTGRKESITQYTKKRSFSYPITFLIEDKGVEVSQTSTPPDLKIEFVNPNQSSLFLSYPISNIQRTNKRISCEIATKSTPNDYIQDGEHSVPIKIKFFVPLMGGGITQLVTNTITLTVPNLIKKPVEVPVQAIEVPPTPAPQMQLPPTIQEEEDTEGN